MKKKTKLSIVIGLACVLIAAGVLLMTLIVMPVLHENECRNRVFDDLKAASGQVRSSVIGIIPKTTGSDGSVTYGGGGSGIVFSKEDGVYYAITAAHVVGSKTAEFKVFSVNTPYSTVNDPALSAAGIEVVSDSFYESLTDAKVEYMSRDIDAAVISFSSEEELVCPEWADSVSEEERILCLGFPDGRYISDSYGTVLGRDTRKVSTDNGTETADTVVKHDAYLNRGSSGGPAFNEKMLLCGMNIGGDFDRGGHFKAGFMLDTPKLKKCLEDWRASR